MFRRILVLATALLAFSAAHAAQVTASLSQFSGASWEVFFAVTNDGPPGQSQDGSPVGFTSLNSGAPPVLPFEVVDAES